MIYMIEVQDDDLCVMYSGPVSKGDATYLLDRLVPSLRNLSDDEYMLGPAMILHTFARYSYILHQDHLYWCAEWPPGLVVVRFSPGKKMAWTVAQSPPLTDDDDSIADEVAEDDLRTPNHQYNLVFNAWDAIFDEGIRQWRQFRVADEEECRAYRSALEYVNSLGEVMESRFAEDLRTWANTCKANLERWWNEGVQLD